MSDGSSGRITGASRPAPSPLVHTIELDGERVLYERSSNQLHVLDRIASLLWSCFDGSSTVAEIARDIADGLGEAPETVEHDAIVLADALAASGLLAPEPPRGP